MSVRNSFYSGTLALFFLTIVLSHKYVDAKPHAEVPVKTQKDAGGESLKLENQDVIVAPEPRIHIPKVKYYSYTQSISLRVGAVAYTLNPATDGSTSNPLVFSGLFMLKRYKSPQIEIGADMANDNTGFLYGSIRYISRERYPYRPFCKWGIGINLDGTKNLASFVDITKNYYFIASGGFEYLIWNSTSLRFEAQGYAGTTNIFASVFVGTSWAW